ncbi:MAG: ABC transporter ATP-binding protein [Clostridia bacterium]|nr:ABC transporter ATP-binding protein [Clostridia bacterium]
MKTEEKKKKKEKKIPLGRTLYCNFLMLSKIAQKTPQYIVFMVIVGLVGGAANSVSTIFTYMLFNALDEPHVTFGKMASYVALILGVNLLIQLFYAWYYEYYQTVTDKKLQHRMHEELFRHALGMDLACYDDPQFYNDYVWAMDESKGRAVQVLDDTARMIRYLITISTLITLMMRVDILVGSILFVGAAVQAALWEVGNRLNLKKNERIKPLHRKNTYVNRVYHLADYAKELRVSRAGENLEKIYQESVNGIVEAEVWNGKRQYGLDLLTTVLDMAAQYVPVLLMLFKLYDGTAQLGAFVASINIIWNLNWSMYDLARNLIRMPENARYVEKYLKFMSYKPTIVSGKIEPESLETIELKNVTFSYNPVEPKENEEKAESEKESGEKPQEPPEEAKNSLEDVSLTIRRGEKVAIVGYNGAGKTTLTKLLMRLYDPTEGEILYNGRNLKDYDIPGLRAKIGTVFQDYKIFAATVAENVLGREVHEEDRDAVTDALTKATFADRLSDMEKGLDTPLTKEFSEDGVNLSGGEAQKVAIARIFARPYELIVMDEPSSALDPAAEYELNHTILAYAKDKTVIFISHRLSTTRMADRILMFADGRLIEEGSHEELMRMNGKYAEMFRLQAEKYRESA